MFKHAKKFKRSQYHDSFHQYKKKSPIKRIVALSVLVVASLFFIAQTNAIESTDEQRSSYSTEELVRLNDVGSGQLLFKPADGTQQSGVYHRAMMLNSAASFDIKGMIATVTLTQSFMNQGDVPLNGLYTFPLPDNAAVNHLRIQIGERVIEGKILEKKQAKRVFEKAKRAGKKASLIVQHRPNLFTNHIANIGANEQITVTLKYVQQVNFVEGKFGLRFPMKITPRYQPRHLVNKQLAQQLLASTHNEGVQRLPVNVSESMEQRASSDHKIALTVNLNAGVDLAKIESASHAINSYPVNSRSVTPHSVASAKTSSQPAYKVTVGHVTVPMDRDFILEWQPSPSDIPRVSLFRETLGDENYALAVILPPSNVGESTSMSSAFARDITLVIDTSGSMQGSSIIQAKQSLLFALDTLQPQDSFNIIAFESRYRRLFEKTVMATPENLEQARTFINKLSANGGTEMNRPLDAALNMSMSLNQNPEAIRQTIFITDGAVSNERELFKLIYHAQRLPRLFTVGIGAAPNGYFMRKAAQFGQGSYTYIANANDVEPKMSALLTKISQPVLSNIALQFQPLHLGAIEQYPKKIPDLYSGEPMLITFKTQLLPTSIQVFGDLAQKGWHQELMLDQHQPSQGITSIWARAKIEDLMDGLVIGKDAMKVKEQVITTSLLHQVMSRYTSFIAVEQELEMVTPAKEAAVKNNPSRLTKKNKRSPSVNQLASVPMPVTAVGWKIQLLIGGLLLLISGVFYRRLVKQKSNKVLGYEA